MGDRRPPESDRGKAPETIELTGSRDAGRIDADRHADILQETGMVGRPQAGRSDYVMIINLFENGIAGKISLDELAKAGVVDDSRSLREGEPRKPEEVKEITVRKSSDRRPGDPEAHFRIGPDGKVVQLRHPDMKSGAEDDEIIVEIDDGGAAQIRAMSEQQKAAARQMIAYIESRYAEAKMSPVIPGDLLDALYREPQIPPPTVRTRSNGYNGHRIGSPRTSMPAPPAGGYEPRSVGRTPARDVAENQAFERMEPSPQFETPEQFKGFIDRVVAAVSSNEGNFTSINWNDNGYGISVGKAQWNQKAGELPSLLKQWHKADPEKFNAIFGSDAQNMLNERFVRNTPITRGSELGNKMARALAEPKFQEVQMELLRDKVLRGFELSRKYGHTSELFVAEVTDMGNQFGWGGVEAVMRKANVANIRDERQAISALQSAGQDRWAGRARRDQKLASLFSPDKQALA